MSDSSQLAASFRDPSGFIFLRHGHLFRQVCESYRAHYDHLMACGLYAALTEEGLLITHEEVDEEPHQNQEAYRVIRPRRVPFISYPYEWCFSQLKAAALLTLELQRRALAHGMTLKDASAYNVQFIGGRPVFIDTLSFETYAEGDPWPAYRQFCQHFLAPLALMSLTDIRLLNLLRPYPDGIPLDLACSLLPFRSRFRFALLIHLHLHARAQRACADRIESVKRRPLGRRSLLALVDNLESAVRRLRWEPGESEWSDYYTSHNYAAEALADKEHLVAEHLGRIGPDTVWDLGANTGHFSRLASSRGATTIAFDGDAACVERNYRACARSDEKNLLPLVLDITNPSPAIGWNNRERMSLPERGPADLVLALGLIHHLAIGSNVPFQAVADFLSSVGRGLIIEFVPKDDPQVARLLMNRKDIFAQYHSAEFERAFAARFTVDRCDQLALSGRILYLMRRKETR